MSFKIIIESLKFYKLKSSALTKIFFVLLIFLRAAMTMAPIGDREFKFLENILNRSFIHDISLALPTRGNWIVIGVYMLGILLSGIIGLFYAEIFILENEKRRGSKISLGEDELFMIPISKNLFDQGSSPESISDFVRANFFPSDFKRNIQGKDGKKPPYFRTVLKDFLKKIPALLALLLLMCVVFIFSVYLFMLPLLIISLMLIFVPLNLMYAHNKLIKSMELSYSQTKGAKSSIFFTMFLHGFLFNLISNFFSAFLAKYHYSFLTIESFLFAFEVLSLARLYALFYQMLALRQPYQIA